MSISHESGIRLAISQALISDDEVPVGAVIFNSNNELIASASNGRRGTHDPSGHAEILALRKASAKLATDRLVHATLFVTMEPCIMCAGAIREAQVSRVVFGAYRDRGAGGSMYDVLRDQRLGPVPEIVPAVLADECADLVQEFFTKLRGN